MAEVIGIDPGLSTGLACFVDGVLDWTHTVPDGVEGFVDWWHAYVGFGGDTHDTTMVIEDYVSDGTVNGRVWSSEVIGALYALHPGPVVRQSRSMKAGLIKGSESDRNGWIDERFPGLPNQHERDAITHALIYLRNKRDSVAVRYWL